MVHRFSRFEIDEDKREARVGAAVIPLQPRVFDLLAYLARHHERVVPKDELLDAVWPGVTVADSSIQRAISLARSAFAEAGVENIVRTYPRQGYRLRADTGIEEPLGPAGLTARHYEIIQAQLERLEKREVLKGSPRGMAMLRLMVSSELAGQGDRLTPEVIAKNLPGDTGGGDAGRGLAVRLEAGDLRARLHAYYAGKGIGDPVRFELPGGRFSPRIHINGVPLDTRDVMPGQEIRYLKGSDGTKIAYAVSGYGYPLVKVGNWLSHLEYDHQSPVWRHWWRALAERYQLVRYDERGCGMSDWSVPEFSFDAWCRDLEEVIDACGLKEFALLGISQGASVAIDYAVKHPKRVSHLVLYGGAIQGRMKRAKTELDAEEARAYRNLIRVGWGRGNMAFRSVFLSLFMPDASPEQARSFLDLQRVTTSPENADRFIGVFQNFDTTALAPQVKSPTLVVHARDDRVVTVDQARLAASLIPGARIAILEGRNHILCEDEPAWSRFLDELTGFLAPRAEAASGDSPESRVSTDSS